MPATRAQEFRLTFARRDVTHEMPCEKTDEGMPHDFRSGIEFQKSVTAIASILSQIVALRDATNATMTEQIA